MNLYDWQLSSADAIRSALLKYGVAADGSEMGTGKTFKACAVAKQLGRPLVVVCPKIVVPEWQKVADAWGLPVTAYNYEKVRTGKTPIGHWTVNGKVFQWTLPPGALLVFDEAHKLGGMDTQQSRMLVAATRQGIMRLLMSGTLIASPLKAKAIGYSLGLHHLTNFYPWMMAHGVVQGTFGLEFKPKKGTGTPAEFMESIRLEIGDKFTRIRKADVPGFPQCQLITQFVQTKEMPDLETGDYGVAARQAVELLKLDAITEQTNELVEAGNSVAIFVNFVASLESLIERFPNAPVIRGGQSAGERATAINSFQQNEQHVILIMSQAGGTGLSLHDLHGRPRAAIISPGVSVVEFLQVLGRIHRAGSLSNAINYIFFASGVPVERRIRTQLDKKINNLSALNDTDLYGQSNDTAGDQTTSGGADDALLPAHSNECGVHPPGCGTDQPNSCGGAQHGAGSPGSGAGATTGATEVGGPIMNALPGIESVTAPTLSASSATIINKPVEGAHVVGVHTERKHARCSPSKLKNLEICPSYEPDNDGPVHPVTLRGTAMHEALETGNDSALLPDNENEEQRLVNMCREFLADEIATATQVIDEAHMKTHDKDVQGFVDKLMLYREAPGLPFHHAKIRDFKMGFNPVDAPDKNPQAIAYTVGAFIKYPSVETISFAFLIPRLDLVLEHTFNRSELPELKLRLSVIADRVRKLSGKEFNKNCDNCLYCGRKATCTALVKDAITITNGYNDDAALALPTEFHSSLITDPVQMARALNMADVMEKWVDSVKSHALKLRLEVGVEIPGRTLVEREGKPEIVSPAGAWEVAKTFGVTQPEFMDAAKLSLPKLEAAVKDKVEKGKAKRVEEFNDALSDAGVTMKQGKTYYLQRERKAKPALTA